MGRQGVSDAIIRHRKLDQKIIMAKEIALTAEVARFVTRTQPARIPRNVMHLGKRSLLDGLGLAYPEVGPEEKAALLKAKEEMEQEAGSQKKPSRKKKGRKN